MQDNGKGIDKGILHTLFHKFTTKSEIGTGLGLYISKNIEKKCHQFVKDLLKNNSELLKEIKNKIFLSTITKKYDVPTNKFINDLSLLFLQMNFKLLYINLIYYN